MDLFAGVLFKDTESFGPDTTASLAIYYLGLGMTWKFGECIRAVRLCRAMLQLHPESCDGK